MNQIITPCFFCPILQGGSLYSGQFSCFLYILFDFILLNLHLCSFGLVWVQSYFQPVSPSWTSMVLCELLCYLVTTKPIPSLPFSSFPSLSFIPLVRPFSCFRTKERPSVLYFALLSCSIYFVLFYFVSSTFSTCFSPFILFILYSSLPSVVSGKRTTNPVAEDGTYKTHSASRPRPFMVVAPRKRRCFHVSFNCEPSANKSSNPVNSRCC